MDEAAKKSALRMIPYGLYLVGTREADAADHAKGLNAFVGSWVTQTSFKPPMLVVCVKSDSRGNAMIRATGALTLNLLGSGQKELAQKFFKDVDVAQKTATEGTMQGVPYRVEPETGCPVFPDLPAWVACKVEGELAAGAGDEAPDHTPFLVRVVDAGFSGPDKPLTKDETGWQYGG